MTPTENDLNLHRVHRGGSWYSNEPSWVRAASRVTIVPARRGNRLGFRTTLPGRMKR